MWLAEEIFPSEQKGIELVVYGFEKVGRIIHLKISQAANSQYECIPDQGNPTDRDGHVQRAIVRPAKEERKGRL